MRNHQEERGKRAVVSVGGREGGRERDVAHGFPWSHLATLQRRKGAETKYHQCRMP